MCFDAYALDYLRQSSGDLYCRLIAAEDMSSKSFRGTRLASGLTISRDFSAFFRTHFTRLQSVFFRKKLEVRDNDRPFLSYSPPSRQRGKRWFDFLSRKEEPSPTPLPSYRSGSDRFTVRDKVRMLTEFGIPSLFLLYSALRRPLVPFKGPSIAHPSELRFPRLVLLNCVLLLSLAISTARFLCPFTVKGAEAESALSVGDTVVGVNSRRVNTLRRHELQSILDNGPVLHYTRLLVFYSFLL